MSLRVMSRVWDTVCESHTQKLVLLALADNANDEGKCWPSTETLARKCQVSDRTIQVQIAVLAKNGLLNVRYGGGRGQTNLYLLFPENPERISVNDINPEAETPKSTTETPKSTTETPKLVQETPNQLHPEPYRTVIEPSGTNTPPRVRSRQKPADVQEVIALGDRIGVAEQDCRDWFRDCEACEWRRGDGTPFDNWPRQLVLHRQKIQEIRGNKAGLTIGRLSVMDINTAIRFKEERANGLRERYCASGPLGDTWSDENKHAIYTKIRREVRDLKEQVEKLFDK